MNSLTILFKEFASINRSTTYLDQARIEFPNGEEDPLNLRVVISPTAGVWRDAEVKFSLVLPKDYPNSKPKVTCLSRLFHPNISMVGNVCFSMFSSDWNASYRLEHYINGLLWLLNNPNPDSALNMNAAVRDEKEFARLARLAAHGEQVKGKRFDRILLKIDTVPPIPMMAELAAFLEVALTKTTFAEALASAASVPKVGWLEVAREKSLAITLLKPSQGVSSPLSECARALNVAPKLILKEIVITINGSTVVMLLSNGEERISMEKVASLFNCTADKIRLTPGSKIEGIVKMSQRSIAPFGHGDAISAYVFNERILKDDLINTDLVCSTGITNILMKMSPAILRSALPADRVKVANILA